MSKRGPGANFGGDEERYGGYSTSAGMDNSDKPMKATAAQLARRKIAQTKKPGGAANRSRGASPAFPAPAGNFQSPMQPQQQQATFNTGFDFQFGAQQSQTQNGGSATPFQFGASTPAPSFPPQQNGTPTTNMFGQSAAPSFGGNMNSSSAQNGFTFGSSFGSTQPSQQTNAASSFGGFGQTQQNNTTPATATSSTFGSFGQPQGQNGTNSFLSGQTQSQQETQQSNAFGGFGANKQEAPKTSTTFGGFGATQQDKQEPQQNGFMSGGAFGQKPQEGNERQNTPSFGGFGQQPSQGNDKPSTPFGGFPSKTQNTSTTNDQASNIFGSFSQKTQENDQPSTPFAGFGQKPQVNGEKPSSMFAGIGQKAAEGNKLGGPLLGLAQKTQENGDKPSSIFSGVEQKPQQNGDKANSLFSRIGPKPAENVQKSNNPFENFQMQQPNANKDKAQDEQPPKAGIFGLPQQNGEKTQTPATSIFNSKTTTQPEQQAAKPATSNIFGGGPMSQPDQPNGEKKGLFGAIVSFDAPKSNGSVFDSVNKAPSRSNFNFSSDDPSQVYNPANDPDNGEDGEEATSGNIYGQSATKPPAEQPKTGMFGSSFFPNKPQQETNTNGPDSVPSKSLFQTQPSSTPETPAADAPPKSRSLFDRIAPAGQESLSKAASPQKSLFEKASETPATTKPHNLFAPQTTSTTPAAPSMFQPSQTSIESQTPKASPLFQKPAAQPSTSGPSTPAHSQPAAPSTALKAPATAPPARAAAPPSQVKASGPMAAAKGLSQEQQQRLKSLNQAVLSHLQNQVVEQDWTPMFQYYMEQAAKIRGVAPPAGPAAPVSQATSSAPASGNSGSLFSSAAKPAAPKAIESSTNMFSQASKTPAASTFNAETPKQSSTGNLFKPPATAPPAAKKRIFEEDNDEPAQAPGSEKRVKPNEALNYPKLPETASSAAKLFESSLDKSKSATTGGFNPSTKSMFSTSTSQTPSASAFKMPTFTAPASGNGFLSAFGKKADAEGEKERKKRKADGYDSDDETPQEWEKRDREEQEAKRAKIMEASKSGTGFKFSTATSPTKPVTAKEVEKAQGPGDNTWKPETPIKFSASTADTSTTPAVPPPKFGLFGSNATPGTSSSTESGKLAPPSTNFNFGPKTSSLTTSRATTPGVTTDGEASNAAEGNEDGEPSDEQNDAQIDADDMTALMPVEREENEVLLELKNLTSKKFFKAEGDEKPTWVSKGDGRAYLLKNKASGKTRILQKVGLNQLALNFEPIKGIMYELHPKKNTMVIGTFMDHLHCQPAKLDRFFMTTATADEAKDLVRILTEGTPK